MRKIYLLGLLYVGSSLAFLLKVRQPTEVSDGPPLTVTIQVQPTVDPVEPDPTPARTPPQSAAGWFQTIKPYCNAVEVETRMRWSPPPASEEGAAYGAACLALAGDTEGARALILDLPEDVRWRAVGVVFNVGHPVADAGDDLATGPLMELVVDFWPNHYMALYHAGAANYELGEHTPAKRYLEAFLEHYHGNDGWRGNAMEMLRAIDAG